MTEQLVTMTPVKADNFITAIDHARTIICTRIRAIEAKRSWPEQERRDAVDHEHLQLARLTDLRETLASAYNLRGY